jgi:hypothetical protein
VPRRPARVIIKAVSAVEDWVSADYKRNLFNNFFKLNDSIAEWTASTFTVNNNGVTFTSSSRNTSGVQYIALVEFDTDNTGTSGAYFENPTDTTNLQLADGLFSISKGFTANGADNVVVSKSGTIIPTNGWED